MNVRLRSVLRTGVCAALALSSALPVGAQPGARPRPSYPAAPQSGAVRPVQFETPAPPPAPAVPGAPATYPIDLPTALRLADANNPTVGVARARVREAVAQYDRARVQWVPTLTAGPSFFYHGGVDQNRRGDIFTVSRGYFALGAGPTLRVDVGDALYGPLVARQGVRAATATAQAVGNATQLDVAIAYLDLAELQAAAAINADILDRTEQILKSALAGAKGGINKTGADVNRAATEVNLRREEGLVLRGRVAGASARLARLLLLDPTVELVPCEPAIVPLVLVPGDNTVAQLVQTALRARPEMTAAQAGVSAANSMVRQAQMAPLLPKVQADFIGGGLSGGRGDDFSPLQSQYNAGVALVWNVESFGLGNAAQVRGRRAGYDAALYRLRDTEALVSAQVVEAAQMSGARYATLEPAQEAVKQALEMYRKFRDVSFVMPAGPKGQPQFDALEILTAVQALNQARVQYLQQVIEFNRSQFRLYAALGQPPLCAPDTAAAQPLAVPVLPTAPKAAPVPAPRPVP